MAFEDVVRGIIKGILDNPDDVSDAVQDTFLAAWTNLDRLAKRSSAGSWIRTIARNTAIDALRKRRREESISLSQPVKGKELDATLGDLLSDTEPGPEEICVIKAELRSWYQAYSMLPANYRLNLYLRYYMQMEADEVSIRMGITRKAQISSCYRAKKAMKANYMAMEGNYLAMEGLWQDTAVQSI